MSVSRELLAEEGAELSLRAVASRMGMTAPALYRYVANYQELVDLVAFEIDKAATAGLRPGAPSGCPRTTRAAGWCWRRWRSASGRTRSPREFSLVFANPVAAGVCVRRELLTAATSGLYFHGLLIELWQKYDFPHPEIDELDPSVAATLDDPVFPVKIEDIPQEHRGLLWVFIRAWASLYGVVTLEVFGHMDPRIIEGAAMFKAMVREWIPRLGHGRRVRPARRADGGGARPLARALGQQLVDPARHQLAGQPLPGLVEQLGHLTGREVELEGARADARRELHEPRGRVDRARRPDRDEQVGLRRVRRRSGPSRRASRRTTRRPAAAR